MTIPEGNCGIKTNSHASILCQICHAKRKEPAIILNHALGYSDGRIGAILGVCAETVRRYRIKHGLKSNAFNTQHREALSAAKAGKRIINHGHINGCLESYALGWSQPLSTMERQVAEILWSTPTGIDAIRVALGRSKRPNKILQSMQRQQLIVKRKINSHEWIYELDAMLYRRSKDD